MINVQMNHKQNYKLLCPLFALLICLSSCAAIFNGSTQQVAIRSNDEDAEIYVNEQYIGKGTGVTTFRKKKNYDITVRKQGCDAVTLPASKSFDATTLLGILLDLGIITVLVVDGLGTGAWQQFDQTSYVLDPKC